MDSYPEARLSCTKKSGLASGCVLKLCVAMRGAGQINSLKSSSWQWGKVGLNCVSFLFCGKEVKEGKWVGQLGDLLRDL